MVDPPTPGPLERAIGRSSRDVLRELDLTDLEDRLIGRRRRDRGQGENGDATSEEARSP